MAVSIILNSDAQNLNFIGNLKGNDLSDNFKTQVEQYSQNFKTPKRNQQPSPKINLEQQSAAKESQDSSQYKAPSLKEDASINEDEITGSDSVRVESENNSKISLISPDDMIKIVESENNSEISLISPDDMIEIIDPQTMPNVLFQEINISSNIDEESLEEQNNNQPIILATALPTNIYDLQALHDKQPSLGNEDELSSNDRKYTDILTTNTPAPSNSDEVVQDTLANNLAVKSEINAASLTESKNDSQGIAAGTASSVMNQAANNKGVKNEPSKESLQKSAPENSLIESVTVSTLNNANNSDEGLADFGSQSKDHLIPELNTLKSQPQDASFDIIEPDTTSIISSSKHLEAPTHINIENKEEAQSVANQIKTAVHNISNINGKKITINLTPETLGRVEIEVTMHAGKISAIKIEAVKPETLTMLKQHQELLHDALKEVTGGNEASLSFNLKEGNHGESQQQTPTKNAQFLAALTESEETERFTSTSLTSKINDIYKVDDEGTSVDMRL